MTSTDACSPATNRGRKAARRITRYTYAYSGEADFNDEPATETVDLLPLEGH